MNWASEILAEENIWSFLLLFELTFGILKRAFWERSFPLNICRCHLESATQPCYYQCNVDTIRAATAMQHWLSQNSYDV